MNRNLFTAAVRDPIWKHIYMTEQLFDASKSLAFIRLSRIRQLGPAYIVYPGAAHTRASHSYGVYHVARMLLETLVQRGADWVSETGCFSYFAAALFHDAGHFPYTHSLKELPLKNHESLTADIIRGEPVRSLIGKTGADPEQAAAIVDTTIQTDDPETLFFRRLLSGVLDPDKLDYLTRDAFFCGVPYGTQDTDFVLSRLVPHKEKGITVASSAVLSVENLLFSKYMMYRSVYWNRHVRIATAMMKKTLYSALSSGAVTAEELYNQDDEGIYRLIESKQFPAKSAAQKLYEHKLYTIIFEIPFDEQNPRHIRLEDLAERDSLERQFAENLTRLQSRSVNAADILIDIPERISFENDLHIYDARDSFSGRPSVFTDEAVRQFTKALRIIRVGISGDVLPLVCADKTERMLRENL